MLKFNNSILLFLLLGLSMSCEKVIEVDFEDDEQNIAAFALFSPNDVFAIELYSTQSILDESDPEFIKNALVTIKSNDQTNPEEEEVEDMALISDDGNALVYKTDDKVPEGGIEYELQVEHPDFPTITARSIVPATNEITNLELDAFKISKNGLLIKSDTRYSTTAKIEIENNFNTEDHFHLLVWLEEDNRLVPVNIERDVLQEQLGTDATIVNAGNSLVFFGAHFSDEKFAGEKQSLNFNISFILREQDNPSNIRVELRSVSKEYHRYFVDGFRLSQAGSNSYFVNSDNISNNIEGGYGVFAGYSSFTVDTPFRR